MNWYKKAQQNLLTYPFEKSPGESTQQIPPVSKDPQTGENIYNCNLCNKLILEEDIAEWYRDKEKQGEGFNFPQYDKEKVLQGLAEISQYLLPFYNQLQTYIKEQDLESKRNDTYDYGYQSALQRWEVQVPQLHSIIMKYPQIQEMCNISDIWSRRSNICGYLNNSEISGQGLESLSDLILNPKEYTNKVMDFVPEDKTFFIDYMVPVCEECFEEMERCESCSNPILPGENKWKTVWDSDEYICEKCVEDGRMDSCTNCGRADSPEDMTYDENMGSYLCSECSKEKSSEHIEWAENAISDLNLPIGKNQPVSKKVLTNLQGFISRYVKKYGDNPLTEDEWGRIVFLGEKARLNKETNIYLNSIKNEVGTTGEVLNNVSNNVEAQEYMEEKYPNVKSYKDIPFDIEVVDNYSNEISGFTITITPKDEFIEYAEKVMPGASNVWNTMKKTPHHHGTLAYARCGFDGKNLVINNLQRDADYDNYESRAGSLSMGKNKETAKWIDKATKDWDVFLLHLIKSMAIENDINAYLTTFDHQKDKWGNLPIHKSRRTYQEVPETMGFPLEDADNASDLSERGGMYNDQMYQVASNNSWYKKAIQPFSRSLPYYICL
jgi:hypothetical protein